MAAMITGLYVGVFVLWILLDAWMAAQPAASHETPGAWETHNEWVFLAVSTALLFVLIRWGWPHLEREAGYWQSMVENAQEGFWLIDDKAETVYVNHVLAELLGYTPEEMLGRTPFEFADPEGRAVFEAQVGTNEHPGFRHQHDTPRHYEIGLRTRTGDVVSTLFHATSLHDDKGRLRGSYAFVTDLTEIRAWQRELELTRHALEHSFDEVIRATPDGRILDANERACSALGYTRTELLNLSIWDIDPNFSRSEWPDHRDELEKRKYLRFDTLHQCKDGTTYPVEVGVAYVQSGEEEYIFGIARDTTQLQESLSELRRAATVFNHSAEGIVITDSQQRIETVNDAFCRITGYTESEVRGSTPALLHSGLQSSEFYESMWQDLKEHGVWQGEIWNRRKNGETFPEWLTISEVRDDSGELINYVGVFADMTEAHQAQEELTFRTYHDQLTGLPNRVLFQERLEHVLASLAHRGRNLGVVMLDIAGFGALNDGLGTSAGDDVLIAIGQRLNETLRGGDTVARPGGDEFWILLENLRRREDVQPVMQNLLASLREPLTVAGQTMHLKATVGVAIAPEDGTEASELVGRAATALHRAALVEGEEVQYFRAEMHDQIRHRVRLEEALKVAIEEGQLVAWYQPQVHLPTSTVVAVEALVRWEHPEWGLVSPADFIPLAEETGLVVPLGTWVLNQALSEYGEWRNAGLPVRHVAVNVAAAQLRSAELYDVVAAALERTGLPGECLELEITEQGFLGNVDAAVETMGRLAELGVRLSIDDFGTGYCSLAYLKRLPLDTLKIDKTFIDGLPNAEHDRSIVEAILAVAGALDLDVVAEGVETETQLAWLQDREVCCAQGFIYSRPQPFAHLTEFLESHSGALRS